MDDDDDEHRDFRDFFAPRLPRLLRLAYLLCGDATEAEDLVQITLARAYVAWRRVQSSDHPDAYVRRILVNANRRRFGRRRVPEDLVATVPDVDGRRPGEYRQLGALEDSHDPGLRPRWSAAEGRPVARTGRPVQTDGSGPSVRPSVPGRRRSPRHYGREPRWRWPCSTAL
ncbi:sigma factor [Candidatus Frankia nodulisporulans]|uniref:sigma factor n=1 Tax=Candidatus Frankia nodulisporulans TaxID=2060052 RepID=UPI0013D4D1BB